MGRGRERWTCAACAACAAWLMLAAAAAGAQAPVARAERAGMQGGMWVGTWATAPFATEASDSVPVLAGHTLRQVVRTSVAGSALRLRISNECGTEPLTVENLHVAMSAGGGAIDPASDHTATFGGQRSVTIPPGAFALSDPVAMQLPALASVAVSLYLPVQRMGVVTWHGDSAATSYVAPAGDVSGAGRFTNPQTVDRWYFLKGIDVEAPKGGAVVAFGDSITDGAWVMPDTNHRWPDFLAERLQRDAKTAHLGVLDEGIGGNRVLMDGTGPSALKRWDRDVAAQAGVRSVIVLEGINDIGRIANGDDSEHALTAGDLEQGLAQMAARGHELGIRVYGGTITPYEGAGYFSARGEQVREAVNAWIRTSGTFDGVMDFDKAVRDPAHPNRFLPKYDHGDHLHPSDAGYEAMADAVDVKLLQ